MIPAVERFSLRSDIFFVPKGQLFYRTAALTKSMGWKMNLYTAV
jgi:hypothetical protein